MGTGTHSATAPVKTVSDKVEITAYICLYLDPSNGSGRMEQVQLLIQSAYQMPLVRVVGGPAWPASERFDIAAKAPDNPSPAVMRSMVRGLLSDRFRLRVHTEKRERPIHALTMARRDGRLGPLLRQSDSDCIGAANSPSRAAPTILNPNAPPPCGNGGGRPGFIRGRGRNGRC